MRDDLHVPLHTTEDQVKVQEEDAYIENLIRQHRERLDQIARYYHTGKMSSEQVRNLLEGTPPKLKKV